MVCVLFLSLSDPHTYYVGDEVQMVQTRLAASADGSLLVSHSNCSNLLF